MIRPDETIESIKQMVQNPLGPLTTAAGTIECADQTSFIKSVARHAGSLGDAVGVVKQNVAWIEADLAEAVVRFGLETDQQPCGIQTTDAPTFGAPQQRWVMGCVGVTQAAAAGIEIRIKQRHETVGLGQILLSQLVQVVQDSIRWQSAEHLGPKHASQHGHQQASRHTLSHHITHHQGPTPPFPTAAREFRTGRNEVVVITANLKSRSAACRQFDSLNHRAMIRQQLCLDLRADAELTIHPFMTAGLLEQLVVFNRDTDQIRHQLNMTAMDIGPDEVSRRFKHVQTPSRASPCHHRSGKDACPRTLLLHQAIHQQQLIVIGTETSTMTWLESRQTPQ